MSACLRCGLELGAPPPPACRVCHTVPVEEAERYTAIDAHEAALVGALRTDPRDDTTRQVYADWLEQHGFATRALFLRIECDASREAEREISLRALAVETPLDRLWRAVASRAPLECDPVDFTYKCPRSWDALTPTASDTVRHCNTCARPVYFCATLEDVRRRGAVKQCVAVDATLLRADVQTLLAEVRNPMPMHRTMGMVAVPYDLRPEPPPQAPPRKGLFARLAGVFRRS